MLPSHIPFRYENPREGQEKLILDAEKAFMERKIFLAHAETGLGKTDASLSAALSVALKSDPPKTILFLTPKNAQHAIALEVLKGINEKFNLKLRAVDLVGKKHVCLDEQVMHKEGRTFYEWCKKKREGEACTFYGNARGYTPLQREKAKIYRTAFTEHMSGIHSAAEIKENADDFTAGGVPAGLCPYEVSMELAKKAHVIIADYYHLFSPTVSELVLPKLGKKPENCILIVDEAHNLPERVRGLMTGSLTTKQLQKAQDEAQFLRNEEMQKTLTTIEENIRKEGNALPTNERLIPTPEWKTMLLGKTENWEDFGLWCQTEGVSYLEKSGKESSVLLSVGEFFEKWGNEGEGYARILKKWEYGGDYSLTLRSLDPETITRPILEKMHACMLMSGTLHPTAMYGDVLGIPAEKLQTGFYASPFPKENRLNLIDTQHSTKFTERNETNYLRMAEDLGKIVNQIPGNSVVFFPSFNLLDTIGRKMKDHTMRQLLFQKENMKMDDTQKLLTEFKQHAHGFGGVLLACTSGSFGEGLDFPGNLLLGVVIVGIPLAEMNIETQALVDYYEKRYHKGWHYGYIYPAMGKAIQAAGRVIRSPTDVGTIVFLDKRYTWENYKECLPPTHTYHITQDSPQKVKEFWQQRQEGKE
ncbi:MAG: ATP-dependent DNA helicase [archaeon]